MALSDCTQTQTQTERAMVGLYIIGAFLAAMLVLNLLDFGRID